MTHPLETAVRNLESKTKVANDKASFHQERADYWRRQAATYDAAMNAICEVMGLPEVFGELEEEPKEEPQEQENVHESPVVPPFEEAKAEAVKPFQGNGGHTRSTPVFNRDVLRRELRTRHIRYPLAPSHRSSSHFVRQSLIAACVNHADYQTYLNNGGDDLQDPHTKTNPCLEMALAHLAIDRQKVTDEALVLHGFIYTNGIEGVDYR